MRRHRLSALNPAPARPRDHDRAGGEEQRPAPRCRSAGCPRALVSRPTANGPTKLVTLPGQRDRARRTASSARAARPCTISVRLAACSGPADRPDQRAEGEVGASRRPRRTARRPAAGGVTCEDEADMGRVDREDADEATIRRASACDHPRFGPSRSSSQPPSERPDRAGDGEEDAEQAELDRRSSRRCPPHRCRRRRTARPARRCRSCWR